MPSAAVRRRLVDGLELRDARVPEASRADAGLFGHVATFRVPEAYPKRPAVAVAVMAEGVGHRSRVVVS